MAKQQFIFKVGMPLAVSRHRLELFTIVLPEAVAQLLMWRIYLLNKGTGIGYQHDIFQEFSVVGEMDMHNGKRIFRAGKRRETEDLGTTLLRMIMPKSELIAFGKRIRLNNDGFRTNKDHNGFPEFHFFGCFVQYAKNQVAPIPEIGKDVVMICPTYAVNIDWLIFQPSLD